MKIKLDENVPATLRRLLDERGHDVDSVPEEGLTARPDDDVWRATQSANRFFITQDLDFSDIRRFEPGTHHGILLIRLGDASRRSIQDRVLEVFDSDVQSWTSCFVVATPSRVRVRRPRYERHAWRQSTSPWRCEAGRKGEWAVGVRPRATHGSTVAIHRITDAEPSIGYDRTIPRAKTWPARAGRPIPVARGATGRCRSCSSLAVRDRPSASPWPASRFPSTAS